jgi:hypothetical protein
VWISHEDLCRRNGNNDFRFWRRTFPGVGVSRVRREFPYQCVAARGWTHCEKHRLADWMQLV